MKQQTGKPTNMRSRIFCSIAICAGLCLPFAQPRAAQGNTPEPESNAQDTPTHLNQFLQRGLIKEGLHHFKDAADNQDLFALGLLQALDGLQTFTSGLSRFPYRQDLDGFRQVIPFLRLAGPSAQTGAAEPVTPKQIAALFAGLRAALQQASTTLARIDDQPFKVEVNLSRIRMDLNGDGVVSPEETLVKILGPALGIPTSSGSWDDFIVRFDSADAMWLKGYTHLMTGILEVILTYDWSPVWEQAAHLIFRNPSPEPAIAAVSRPMFNMGMAMYVDLIAALHAMRLDVTDAAGLRRARDQFQAMITCSRISWERIMAETDDDMEWIPSPKQTGPGGARITQEQVDGWMRVLQELEGILAGQQLLPHWRMLPDHGINLDKLVESPPQLDLVMLMQGSALIPYVEKGPLSGSARWQHLMMPFGGDFGRFAIWVN